MKKSHHRKFLPLLVSCVLLSYTLENNAQATSTTYSPPNQYLTTNPYFAPNLYDMANPNGGWCFLVAPYFWLGSISGSVNVKGNSADFSVPFSEVLSHLTVGGEIHLEASEGNWTFMLDPSYLRLTDNANNQFVSYDTDTKIALIDGGVFYRVAQACLANNQYISFEVLGGARYLGLSNSIDIGSRFSVSGHTDLTTPIIGGRIKYDMSPTSHFWLRADGGGFNIGDVTSTWSATAGYSYNITPAVDLGIAYRALDINFTKNSNASMNVLLYGPMLGVGFHF